MIQISFYRESRKLEIVPIILSIQGLLMDKTNEDEFMYIPNDDTQNYPFCSNVLALNLMNQPIKID